MVSNLHEGDNIKPLRLACTGFVSERAGSVAAANALLLGSLVDSGIHVDFFSKPSFVDPRPIIGNRSSFRFVPVVNNWPDAIRRKIEGVPLAGALARISDAGTYNRLLVRFIGNEHRTRDYDAVLWLGDYAYGSVAGLPTISFAQGPPGTDARSILQRRAEIRRIAGWTTALKWELLARLRLSRIGVPRLRHSDHIIVGSRVSRERLATTYNIPSDHISTLPYPIDLALFKPEGGNPKAEAGSNTLRVLWLGRIVPRKRLDLFLDGAASAIRAGLDVKLTIVGDIGFVKGYENMVNAFLFPDRLRWILGIPRSEVPKLLQAHDVLAQPSDEENFGSSVAEAQACGLPVIVGHTNGNADYLCSRDIHLMDDRPPTLAAALHYLAGRKQTEDRETAALSRRLAEDAFNLENIGKQLVALLQNVSNWKKGHETLPIGSC